MVLPSVNPNSGFQQYEIELHCLSFVQVLPMISVNCPVTSWIPAKQNKQSHGQNDQLCDGNLISSVNPAVFTMIRASSYFSTLYQITNLYFFFFNSSTAHSFWISSKYCIT